jgi:hypothetical protein
MIAHGDQEGRTPTHGYEVTRHECRGSLVDATRPRRRGDCMTRVHHAARRRDTERGRSRRNVGLGVPHRNGNASRYEGRDGRLGPLRWEVGRVRKYLTEECCNRADRHLPSDAIDCRVHLCENSRRNLAITWLGSLMRLPSLVRNSGRKHRTYAVTSGAASKG